MASTVERSGKPIEPWHQQVVELMVRYGLSLRLAAQEIGHPIEAEEAEKLFRRKGFQRLLALERQKFYKEIADDPDRNKRTAIGLLLLALQKLADSGEWDKVTDGVLKLAKLEGWLQPETQVSVFQDISQKDLDAIKVKLQETYKANLQREN